jgi:hypothetical protein
MNYSATHFLVVLTLFFLRGCCPPLDHDDPLRPTDARGWGEYQRNGATILGNFVLKEGESASNGKVVVKVIAVKPGDSCAEPGTQSRQATVRLQFVRYSDQSVMCEDIFPEHGTVGFGATHCGKSLDDFGLTVVGVKGINIRDRWAYFVL